MSDFNSSLPVRTQNNGDVVSKLCDGTTTTQTLAIDASGKISAKLNDGSGNSVTSQANGSQQALDVGIDVGGVQIDPRQIRALTSADVVTVDQGTSPWVSKDQSDGPVSPGAAASFSSLAGGQYNSTPPTLTNGQQAALQVDAAGRLLTDANVTLSYDTNYGTVGSGTLRSAAQIGNATGAADFNNGSTGAQTLRTAANQGAPNSAANAWPVVVTSGGSANSVSNPLFVSEVISSGTAVDNYQTSSAVAASASVNQDYTVTAAKTFYSEQVMASASGKMKCVVAYETAAGSGTFNTFWVGFNSTANPQILIPIPSKKQQVAGARIRITLTNLDLAAQDLYSTLSGVEQ